MQNAQNNFTVETLVVKYRNLLTSIARRRLTALLIKGKFLKS